MTQEQRDEKDLEIRFYLENALNTSGVIDHSVIDNCIKECEVTYYAVDQILASLVDDEVAEEQGDVYISKSRKFFQVIVDWNRKEYGFSDKDEKIENYDDSHTSVEKIDNMLVLIRPSSAGTIRKVVYALNEQEVITKELGVYVKNTMLPNSDFMPAKF